LVYAMFKAFIWVTNECESQVINTNN
jgi:hypothetical protein